VLLSQKELIKSVFGFTGQTEPHFALFIVIFAGDDQAREGLPPEGLKLCNRTSHIFIPVQAAYNGSAVVFEAVSRMSLRQEYACPSMALAAA
jgi:hypothetical protein